AALDITGSFTLETWVFFLTFGEGWDDWRGAPRLMAKPFAVNSSYPNSWWFPNYWLMGDSYGGDYIFGGGFMGIDPVDSSWTVNGDLRLDYNFVETQKWYHVAFVYDHDSYPRTTQLLIHDEYGELLLMLNNTIDDSTYLIATSDSALSIGFGGGGDDSWLDGFLDEIRISTVARRFSIPPVILNTSVPENTTDTEGPYEVTTKVTDDDGLKSVTLKYDVGSGWVDVPMTNTEGDIYEGSIEGQQPGTIIKYYIEAIDNNDEVTVDPANAPTDYFSFAIIVEKALVFHLDFEEGSGTPVDKSQFAHECTINGDVTYSADAADGSYSAQFNSAGNGYITVTPSAFLNCYEFTVEMWIKANDLVNNLRLISKEGAGSYQWYQPNYEIKATSAGVVEVGSYCDPGGWNNFPSDSAVTTGSWYHIAYVFKDTLASVIILDANDQIIDQVTTAQVGVPVFTTGNLQLGHAGGDTEPFYNGLMDDVKIYNYAKSFVYTWSPLVADENTVLLLDFEGDLSDASGHLQDGVASSDKVGFAPSISGLGQALYLDNSAEGGAYITIADTSLIDLEKKFSVEASFMLLSKGDSWNNYPRIWAKGGDPWYRTNYYAMVRDDYGFGSGYYSGSAYYNNESVAGMCKLNTWYHLFFLYDEENDFTYFVVHDTLGSTVFEQTMPIGNDKDLYPTDNPLFIGFGGGGSDSYLNGYIDEVRIQNYSLSTAVTDGTKHDILPSDYELSQNYPNPFNPTTNINYKLPQNSKVELAVYNMLGKQVRVLIDRNQNAGSHKITWDGKDNYGNNLTSGIYFYRLKTDKFNCTRKMIFMK
ncbi:MAG: LamG-like jellyroll fold domain-containing protein, partial [bacterium]|nr:LamG-like jellyroll fold domain-containing protein [bacterium]